MLAGKPAELDSVHQEVCLYMTSTFAENTQKSYWSHLRTFLRFCIYFDVEPLPISQKHLLAYIAFLARTLQPQSINNYLNIIRIIHLDKGLKNPLSDNFAVKNLKRGIARRKGSPPKQKLPITGQIMLDIYNLLSLCSSKEISFWAACCVGFFGFLRKINLLPVSSIKLGDSCLLREDVDFVSNDCFVLNISKTKTIQNHERILTIPFVAVPGSVLCPVDAVMNMLIVSPVEDTLPLFSYVENGEVKWWTHSSFTTELRSLLSHAGYQPNDYTCHSFRRGGATLAFRLGMTMNEIKKRGDWASDAVYNYVTIQEDQELLMARDLVKGATNDF